MPIGLVRGMLVAVGVVRRAALLALVGCSSCYEDNLTAAGLCDVGEITSALQQSRSGDVVLLGECSISGAIVVPAGVTLAGRGRGVTVLRGPEEGATVTLVPGAEPTTVRALSIQTNACAGILASGEGAARVQDVALDVDRGFGVALEGGVRAAVEDALVRGPVSVDNATSWPADGDGLPRIGLVALGSTLDLSSVEVRGFGAAGVALLDSTTRWMTGLVTDDLGVGLFASGGSVDLAFVEVARTLVGARLTPAIGVLLVGGVSIDARTTAVREGNGPGVVVVGASGHFEDLEVQRNADVGVWLSATPSLTIEGGLVSDNVLAGILVRGSSGVTLRDTSVENTGWATVISGGGAVEIADGIDLIESTESIVLERVTLRGHLRAGAVLDLDGGDGAGIVLREVSVEGDALGVVAQNGVPRAGWDSGVDRAGRTVQNDADFAANGTLLFLPTAAPSPGDPPAGPSSPLCD